VDEGEDGGLPSYVAVCGAPRAIVHHIQMRVYARDILLVLT